MSSIQTLDTKTQSEQHKQRKYGYGQLLTTYLLPQRRRVLLLVLLLFIGIALQIVNPLIVQNFIDTATAHGPLSTLLYIALAFLLIAISGQAIAIGETYIAENVSLVATNRLRADLMLHCLQLDPAFFAVYTPGELIERVDGDVTKLSNFFSRLMIVLVGNAMLLAGVLFMLFRIDWRIGGALTVFAIVAFVLVVLVRNVGVPYWKKALQAQALLFGFLEERFSGTEDIRSSGAVPYSIRELQQHSRSVLRKTRLASQIGLVSWTTMILLFTIGTAIALAFSVSLYRAGTISIGTVYLIFAYTTLLERPIQQITRQIEDLQQATAGIVRIRTLFGITSGIVDGTGASLPPGPLSVKMRDVTFAYTEDAPTLQHISLTLRPGEVLGLLGHTGSGKTTLTKLLVRLYDPQQGNILLDEQDVRAMRLHELRQHVGVVTQDVQLFNATVRDNLTFFDQHISDERILQTLHDIGLKSWYASLSDGLDTRLAPGGSGLSAGEAQLLAFARVFLKAPGLVILDEASSRLDPATERHLERAIDHLLQGRTCIIIAHRLATVQRANTIMILENGVCREYGARTALAQDGDSRFSHLLHTGLEGVLS
jgi:ABC-type multidrug transport system fused ATPase/permease subunit